MTVVRRQLPPFDLTWNPAVQLIGTGEVARNRLNAGTGMTGTSIAAFSAGHAYSVTSVGFSLIPREAANYLVTVNARVWFRGNQFAFFNGYVVTYAALRVFAMTGNRRFENTTDIWNQHHFLAINWAEYDFEPRRVSVTVPVQSGLRLSIFADAVQWVSAWGGITSSVSNLSMIINDIIVSTM